MTISRARTNYLYLLIRQPISFGTIKRPTPHMSSYAQYQQGLLNNAPSSLHHFNVYLDRLLDSQSTRVSSNKFTVAYVNKIKRITDPLVDPALYSKFIETVSVMTLMEKTNKAIYQCKDSGIDFAPVHAHLQETLASSDYVSTFQEMIMALSNHPLELTQVFDLTSLLLLNNHTRLAMQHCLSSQVSGYNNPHLSAHPSRPSDTYQQIVRSTALIATISKHVQITSLNTAFSIFRILQFLITFKQDRPVPLDKQLIHELFNCIDRYVPTSVNANTDRFVNFIYIVRSINTHKISQKLYTQQLLIVQGILENLDYSSLSLKNRHSVLFSVTSDNIVTPALASMIVSQACAPQQQNSPEYSQYYIRLLKCGLQLRLLDSQFIIRQLPMIKSQLVQLKTVGLTQYQVFLIELCMRVMSLEVTDSKLIAEAGVSALFQEIFDSLETFLQMDVKYVFKLHYLCFIMRAFRQELPVSLQNCLDDPRLAEHMNANRTVIISAIPGASQQSFQEFEVSLYLENMGIPFLQEYKVGDLMSVDYFLPEHQVVIELQGPFHFLKPDHTLNLTSRFRLSLLKQLGYSVITLDYHQKTLISQQQQLLSQLQQYL